MAGLLALATLASAACSPNAGPALSHTFATPEDAARAVLNKLAVQDADGLLALSLTEHEFRRIVWPELPSSRPAVGLPVEYAWGRLHQNSRAQLSMTLAEHGGRRYELVTVRFRGDTSQHDSYTVHRDTELIVRDRAGQAHTFRLFGSLLERGGRWKIFSFVVD